jgi:hypothetical protein
MIKAKVHFSWLGPEAKKTYIILSLVDQQVEKTSPSKIEELVQKYSARLVGVFAAMYFTNNEAAQTWLRALIYLLQP